MLQVYCTGPPYEIGYSHGVAASAQIASGIKFYTSLFQQQCHMNWSETCEFALRFLPYLESRHRDLVEEMKGVADGANIPFESILALNVRTELAFGMYLPDGCTSLAWLSSDAKQSFLAQNWDWQHEQKPNLISLRIRRLASPPAEEADGSGELPVIQMITEAGIIGKIGMNSAGVGVCLNAIRARGVKYDALPCHLALRRCLEASSRDAAVIVLKQNAISSACHILVADAERGGIGLECSALDIEEVKEKKGVVTHTNHYILPHHPDVREQGTLEDSPLRLTRINEIVDTAKKAGERPSTQGIYGMLKDQQGYPTGINRYETPDSTTATLFTIVMDLNKRNAKVTLGRPTEVEDTVILEPEKA